MFARGNYRLDKVYFDGKPSWLAANTKYPIENHSHVDFKEGTAARMIVVRANKGAIPDHYPYWMVVAINRLWFGKNFLEDKNLNNDNLFTKDPVVRLKRRCKKKDRPNKRKLGGSHAY